MEYRILTDYFDGAGAKYLTAVEIDSFSSHQHEFQGIGSFREILGTPDERLPFPTTFYWLEDDDESEPLTIKTTSTWYDARRNQADRTPEYRLYYPAGSEAIVQKARIGDLLVIVKTNESKLLIILCPSNTTIERQLLWLFGLNPQGEKIDVRVLDPEGGLQLGFAARSILDALDIELRQPEPDSMEELIDRYGTGFPPGREFAQYARATLTDIDPMDCPDQALTLWMDHTEKLFFHLERYLISERIRAGFVQGGVTDVESFLEFSKSIHNRRRSRAGGGLEYHVEELLKVHDIRHTMKARTEGHRQPDFIFPGESEYHTQSYSASLLTMLGVKRTCKDRWRQVLSEARRIKKKHLLTLEPSITIPQTEEMKSEDLQLVVPRPLFDSYRHEQLSWLMDVKEFFELVRGKQQYNEHQ